MRADAFRGREDIGGGGPLYRTKFSGSEVKCALHSSARSEHTGSARSTA